MFDDRGPEFIRVKGGWINPVDIQWVQTSKQNENLLMVSLPGIDRPVPLNEEDSNNLILYLEQHTWEPIEDVGSFTDKGELEDAV